MMHRIWPITLCLVFMGATTVARADHHSDPGGTSGPVLLKVGKVYAGPNEIYEPGAVLIRDGKIDAMGESLQVIDDVRVIDLPEATITAGLIDAAATVGYRLGFHDAEHGSEVVPETRALDTVDLHDAGFADLAAQGVTTVYISPDAASVIGGQGAIVRTAGPRAQRIITDTSAVKATVGREPIVKASFNRTPSGFRGTSFLTRRPTTRMGLTWVLRKAFHDAQMLSRGETPGTHGEGSPSADSLPILIDIVKGERPLRIQARAQNDILTALRVAREFNLTFVLEEGTEAYKCIDELKAANVPVIYGPIFDYPTGWRANTGEANQFRFSAPRELLDAGLTMALSACELQGEGGLGRMGAYARRCGLTRKEVLTATTTTPAEILGIADRAGVIAAGRVADLVVWSGEPFEATSQVNLVFAGGALVSGRIDK